MPGRIQADPPHRSGEPIALHVGGEGVAELVKGDRDDQGRREEDEYEGVGSKKPQEAEVHGPVL